MTKFKFGDEVCSVFDYDNDEYAVLTSYKQAQYGEELRGTITKIIGDEAEVQWDEASFLNDKEKPVKLESLLLESEFDHKFQALEDEFNVLSKQVEAKMEQAAKIIEEAAQLAADHNMDFGDLDDACYAVDIAMTTNGWNSSSC
jgi:hypothetical protein